MIQVTTSMHQHPGSTHQHPGEPDPQAAIRSNPVFAAAQPDDLWSMIQQSTWRPFQPGQHIIAEGSLVENLYILLDGTVRVFHQSSDGREATVKHLNAPCTFAEMEILAGEPEMLEGVQAITRIKLLQVPASSFITFIHQNMGAAMLLLKDVCTRFCIAARNERAVFFEVGPRVASLLLSYADLFGKPTDNGVRIAHLLTQQDLAHGLGVTVRSVARILAEWKQAGWVARHKGWFVLHAPEELERICHGLRHNLNYRFQAHAQSISVRE